MAYSVAGAARLALAAALGCAYILAPILLEFLHGGVSPRRRSSTVLDAAATVVLVTLPVTYLLGVVLVYLHVAPAALPVTPGVTRRLSGLACAVASALVVAVSLAAFMVLAGAGGACSPPACGGQ